MDCSAAPIQLHIGLKYICRVYGLTPHRSTGRCPYELVEDGPCISLFPGLTAGSARRGEQTTIQHSVSRLAKRTTFSEGDEVIVYDLKSKLSSAGKILEVLGSNTYLADYGKGPQHISGDVITRLSDVAKQQRSNDGSSDKHSAENDVGGRLSAEADVFQDREGDVSVDSDSSEDETVIGQEDFIHRVPVRRRRRRPVVLGPVREQRLRTRP